MSQEKPKQYLKIGNKTILRKTIESFLENPAIEEVLVVIGEGHEEFYKSAIEGLKILPFTLGGKTRQESVFNGLKAIESLSPKNVLIHDAARPFISQEIISNALKELESGEKAVIPIVPTKDTSKLIENNYVIKTINRESLYSVQTPQCFSFKTIFDLHKEHNGNNFTDDSALCEYSSVKVKTIEGDNSNLKITTNQDLIMANKEINSTKTTLIGSGFDVHSFEEGNEVIICGTKIPFSQKLKGHSDADVGWHALTDAILGAIGLGDIGEHFSDKDEKWKNADSIKFLQYAVEETKRNNGIINNADITIICEAPKLFQYKQMMKEKTAQVLDIAASRVNIKATTTEKMGFLGRGEGIAASAVVSITI